MRKKLAGIHLLAPLSETDIVDYSRNLDRELIVNSTIVTDAIVDTVEKTNYIVTFEYDTTLDGGTHQIRRSIPTLELLSYTGENMSGAHWVNVEYIDYHYITSGTTTQHAFEELDEQLTKVCYLKHLVDGVGDASLISSNDNKTPLSTVDNSEYAFVLGNIHTLTASNYGVILGGYDSNILSSLYSSIFNGYNNTITHSYASFINSGRNNTIDADTDSTFIISGMYNKIEDAAYSGIIGGHDNYIYGSNNSYGSFVIGSVYGYIDNSEFSVISNTAMSYIIGGKYNGISVSAYIDIVNSTSSSVITSTNHTISNSTFTNVIGSNVTTPRLSIYRSTLSSISNSTDACLWYADNSGIINSLNSSIGYESVSSETISTSKTTDHLVVDDVTGFSVGQSVTLYGAEFNTYKNEYIIYSIDIANKLMYFCDGNNNTISFDINNTSAITVKAINSHTSSYTIVSNTSDTIVLNGYITVKSSIDRYITIDGIKYKYNAIIASGTSESVNTIKLVNYGTSVVVLFTPNELAGKILRNYEYNTVASRGSVSSRGSIISSINSNIGYTDGTVILAGYDNYCNNGTCQLIYSSGKSTMSSTNTSSIGSSIESELKYASNSAMLGGAYNRIDSVTQCGIFASHHSYITKSNNSVILGGYYNTINNFTNVSIIAGKAISAWRSDVLMTPSITLTDKTLELKDRTPKVNQTLVVSSVNNNVATLDWGYAGGVDLSTYSVNFQGISEMLIGARMESSGTHYINLYDVNASYSNFIVGLTLHDATHSYYDLKNDEFKSSYAYVDGIITGLGGVCDYSGLHIDVGYTYTLTYQVNHISWGGSDLNSSTIPTLTLGIQESTTVVGNADGTVTLKNSSDPVVDMTTYKKATTSRMTYTSTDTNDPTSPNRLRLSQVFNTTTRELTFAVANLYFNINYAETNSVTYSTNGDNHPIIDWTDIPGPTPEVGSKIAFWSENQFPSSGGEPTTVTATSYVDGRRYVQVAANIAPNETNKTGHIRYDDLELPVLGINMTCKVVRISNSLADALKAIIQ